MRDIFQWFVYSSKNPQLVSLTVKGLVPMLLLLGIDATGELEGAIEDTVMGIGLTLSALATLYGLVRKIWLSF